MTEKIGQLKIQKNREELEVTKRNHRRLVGRKLREHSHMESQELGDRGPLIIKKTFLAVVGSLLFASACEISCFQFFVFCWKQC